jgi:hypothetical protein
MVTGQDGNTGSVRDRVERFRAWLESFGEALERADPEAAAALFVLEASWRPGPFLPVLRGRAAIRAHVEGLVAARPGMVIRGRALGMGTTYGVAHWVAAWEAPSDAEPAAGAPTSDGILLAAFDPVGRCTSLREWSVVGEGHSREEEREG